MARRAGRERRLSGIVIVGGGHAGGSVASLLRLYGFEGAVTVVGEEPVAPYQRPPLSKAYLKGEADLSALELKGEDFYAEHDVTLLTGVRAVELDRGARAVRLLDGGALPYDICILATGARPRRLQLPGADLPGVLALRTVLDADALKAALVPGARLAVVGGGYVGLEAAAGARALGAEAVVIEREARVLARVACARLSAFYQDRHRREGVEFRLEAEVLRFEAGADGRVAAVQLADGERVACTAALVGVGAVPNDELARAAGLSCPNGVAVDENARTEDPAVFAIGDVSWRPLPVYDRAFRLESVPNALEQAKQAAAAIVGKPRPPDETPWFWSDQYEVKLQIAGVPFDADEVLLRGDPESGRFAVFHLAGDVIRAVEAVNAPAEFLASRQLIARRTPVSKAALGDPAVSMKAVAA
ncbi:MAG: FAD-dependent oxidoreductase [Proteobacteria bacterium]|nr:FAD-dependent oxidoreductase [Pseudomonadota bacterium]